MHPLSTSDRPGHMLLVLHNDILVRVGTFFSFAYIVHILIPTCKHIRQTLRARLVLLKSICIATEGWMDVVIATRLKCNDHYEGKLIDSSFHGSFIYKVQILKNISIPETGGTVDVQHLLYSPLPIRVTLQHTVGKEGRGPTDNPEKMLHIYQRRLCRFENFVKKRFVPSTLFCRELGWLNMAHSFSPVHIEGFGPDHVATLHALRDREVIALKHMLPNIGSQQGTYTLALTNFSLEIATTAGLLSKARKLIFRVRPHHARHQGKWNQGEFKILPISWFKLPQSVESLVLEGYLPSPHETIDWDLMLHISNDLDLFTFIYFVS